MTCKTLLAYHHDSGKIELILMVLHVHKEHVDRLELEEVAEEFVLVGRAGEGCLGHFYGHSFLFSISMLVLCYNNQVSTKNAPNFHHHN